MSESGNSSVSRLVKLSFLRGVSLSFLSGVPDDDLRSFLLLLLDGAGGVETVPDEEWERWTEGEFLDASGMTTTSGRDRIIGGSEYDARPDDEYRRVPPSGGS